MVIHTVVMRIKIVYNKVFSPASTEECVNCHDSASLGHAQLKDSGHALLERQVGGCRAGFLSPQYHLGLQRTLHTQVGFIVFLKQSLRQGSREGEPGFGRSSEGHY